MFGFKKRNERRCMTKETVDSCRDMDNQKLICKTHNN